MTLYDSVDFPSVLCDARTGYLHPEGTGIAFTVGVDTSAPCGCEPQHPHPNPNPNPNTQP